MQVLTRYLRLYFALGRYGLARELSFRVNFLVKLFVEVLWLGILLAFYKTVFGKTTNVGGWTEPEYLFFVGCYFALAGLIEALFLANCSEFAELVRTGDLDFYLLKPIDEQFLVTCRDIDWSSMANVFMGAAVMGIALYKLDWPFDPGQRGLSADVRLRLSHRLQHVAAVNLRVRMVQTQPKSLRALVALHQLDALPEGDLLRQMGVAHGLVLLIRGADPAGGQCPRALDGQVPRRSRACHLHRCCGACPALCQPKVFSIRPTLLSQCK